MRTYWKILGLTLALSGFTLVPSVRANTLNIDYFTIGENDKDANRLLGGTFTNEVQSQLGPDGLPVLNTVQYGCTSNCISPVGMPTDLTSTGEFTYWSPALNNGGPNGTSDVTYTGTATVTLPFNQPANFFPPNGTGTSDALGFQAAKLYGKLYAASTETISFTIGANDMAFAFLDGKLVCSLGGVHPNTPGTCVTPFNISAGYHDLQVFFVDINNVQSGFTFNVTTTDVGTQSVPEPATLTLFGLGLIASGAARRRGLAL